MGAYLDEQPIPRPLIDGATHNAFVDENKVWNKTAALLLNDWGGNELTDPTISPNGDNQKVSAYFDFNAFDSLLSVDEYTIRKGGYTDAGYTLTSDANGFVDGTQTPTKGYTLIVNAGSHPYQAEIEYVTIASPELDPFLNKSVEVSFYLFPFGPTDEKIECLVQDMFGNPIVTFNADNLTIGAWNKVSHTFTMPDNLSSIDIYVFVLNGVTCYFAYDYLQLGLA